MKKISQMLCVLLIIYIIFPAVTLKANDDAMISIENNLDMLDFSEVKTVIGSTETAYRIDFKEIVEKAISGELDLSFSGIINSFFKLIFNELYLNASLLRNLLIIGLLSALLKNLTDAFDNKSVGELGFYISYIALIIVLFNSFKIGIAILQSLVSTIADFIIATIPLIMSLVIMSGNVTGAYVFNSVLIVAINLITVLIRDLFVPVITIVSTLQIINYLTENEALSNLSDLLKDIITWALKAVAILFVSILTIQKISAPILNTLALKTAKSTVNVVPVVGEILTGAIETFMYWIEACKSGVLVAALLAIVAICAIPIIKLIALIITYKITAAIIQPICDKRIIKCIDTIGDYTALMLSAGTIVVVMFTFAAMVILSI